jgi:hypothetical protein
MESYSYALPLVKDCVQRMYVGGKERGQELQVDGVYTVPNTERLMNNVALDHFRTTQRYLCVPLPYTASFDRSGEAG